MDFSFGGDAPSLHYQEGMPDHQPNMFRQTLNGKLNSLSLSGFRSSENAASNDTSPNRDEAYSEKAIKVIKPNAIR